MLVEAANRCGADTSLSEDMGDGVRYGATLQVNPFVYKSQFCTLWLIHPYKT